MRWVLGSGLRFWRLVMALALGLVVFGIAQLRSAPVDVYPEFTPPAVQIQTEALGLSAAEVEQLITVPLEQDLLNGVPWLDRIHSSSMPGLSAIDLTFQPDTNLYAARQMVQERLGSGVVLDRAGHILTNAHVAGQATKFGVQTVGDRARARRAWWAAIPAATWR